MIGLLEQFYKNEEIQSVINGLEDGLKSNLYQVWQPLLVRY